MVGVNFLNFNNIWLLTNAKTVLWHHKTKLAQFATTGGFEITALSNNASFDCGGKMNLIVYHLNFQQWLVIK